MWTTRAGTLVFLSAVAGGGCSALYAYDDDPEVGDACANGLDDDVDGAADCEDPDCEGACPELSERACGNGRDDDGDGRVDLEEPACWLAGALDTTRCFSFGGGDIEVDAFTAGLDARGSWRLVPDPPEDLAASCEPTERDCLVLLEPPDVLPGLDIARFRFLATAVPVVGGDTLSVVARVVLDPPAPAPGEGDRVVTLRLALVPPALVPGTLVLPASERLFAEEDAVTLTATLRRGPQVATLALGLVTGGPVPRRNDTPPVVVEPGGFFLALEATDGELRVSARATTGAPPDVVPTWRLPWPAVWTRDLDLSLAAWADLPTGGRADDVAAAALLREVNLRRAPHDPCGYPVPQLPSRGPDAPGGDDPGRVLAAAAGPALACAVGQEEDPAPPEPGDDLALASWRAESPLEPVTVVPPGRRGEPAPRALLPSAWSPGARTDAPDGLGRASGAVLVAAPSGGFEGVLRTAEGWTPIRSDDCARWARGASVPRGEAPAELLALTVDPTTGDRTLFVADGRAPSLGDPVILLRAPADDPTAFVEVGTASLPDRVVDERGVELEGGSLTVTQILDGPDPLVWLGEADGHAVLVAADAAGPARAQTLLGPTGRPSATDRFGVRDPRWLTVRVTPGAGPEAFLFVRGAERPEVQALPRSRRTAVERVLVGGDR